MKAKKSTGRRRSMKRSARTSTRASSSRSKPKLTELGFQVVLLPNGDVQLTVSEWLAKKCLTIAVHNHAQFYGLSGMPQISAALKNLARDLKCEGVTIDG